MLIEVLVQRCWRGLFITLAVAFTASPGRADAAPAPTEYEVKAAYLFNFAKFVTWPPPAFATPDEPLRVGILGDDPFGGQFAEIVADRKVQGRRLVIVRGSTVAALSSCHVLFISSSEQERLGKIVAELRRAGSHALTVADQDDTAVSTVMIRFVVDDNKVRFAINPKAAAEAGLSISSKLLSLAMNTRNRG